MTAILSSNNVLKKFWAEIAAVLFQTNFFDILTQKLKFLKILLVRIYFWKSIWFQNYPKALKALSGQAFKKLSVQWTIKVIRLGW